MNTETPCMLKSRMKQAELGKDVVAVLKEARLEGVYQELDKINVSQMLITDPISIYYLTGKLIEPMERLLALYIRKGQTPKLFLNRLFFCPEELGVEKIWMDDHEDGPLRISLETDHAEKLGVDKELPAKYLLPLMEYGAGTAFVNTSIAVDYQRGIKDEEDQRLMIRSSQINDAAMEEFQKLLRPGITEAEMAEQFPEIYKRLGADRGAGAVSFGKNAADPHHKADNTVLQEGDAVLLDISGSLKGYRSDMTRTFFYHHVPEQARDIYEIVRRANQAAEQAVRPGGRLCELDRIARDIITEAGYGAYFTHRLGHFIGLQVHEYGELSSTSRIEAKAGMVFSIEPGIYLPDQTGVRIEDLILVTDAGCRILNHFPKELRIIP